MIIVALSWKFDNFFCRRSDFCFADFEFKSNYAVGISNVKIAIIDRHSERTIQSFDEGESFRSIINLAVFIAVAQQVHRIRTRIG